MDYFDTEKKYRDKNLKKTKLFLFRIAIIIFVAFTFWQIGQRGQFNTKSKYILEISTLEKDVQVYNEEINKLKYEINLLKKNIEEKDIELKAKPNNELGNLLSDISKLLSNGVNIIQVKSALLELKIPSNCSSEIKKDLYVSTPIFNTPQKSINFFNKGLSVTAEGISHKTFDRVDPWFDENKPIDIIIKILGYEKNYRIKIPKQILIPIDKKLIILSLKKSDLRGNIALNLTVCN